MMKLLKELPIDESLTPEIASNRGLQWEQDVIYDRESPLEAMQELIDLVEKKGYKFGKPAGSKWPGQGLYAPSINKMPPDLSGEIQLTSFESK